jgi:plasmid stabilization system protein ParE
MTVRFHPDAAAELDAAAEWYENEQPALGEVFLTEIFRAAAAIEESPSAWATFGKSRRVRRFVLARFPFAILYQLDGSSVVILAIAHTRRRPNYWRARRLPGAR